MSKVEWGKKVVCSNCEAKFYDLNRKPIICPSCGTEYIETTIDPSAMKAKQVFTENVDVSEEYNLVGSDASESIAEVEDIEIDEGMDEDTISLEDSESDVEVIAVNDEVADLEIADDTSSEEEEV